MARQGARARDMDEVVHRATGLLPDLDPTVREVVDLFSMDRVDLVNAGDPKWSRCTRYGHGGSQHSTRFRRVHVFVLVHLRVRERRPRGEVTSHPVDQAGIPSSAAADPEVVERRAVNLEESESC